MLSCLIATISLDANPFTIDFSSKEMISNGDYIAIQNQLRSIDIKPLLKDLYPSDSTNYSGFDDFLSRCTRGLRQTLINLEKGQFPSKHLEMINSQSDMCFVTCVPYDRAYPTYIHRITEALRKHGFNGFFLYYIGGFPNPTGQEIKYVGVPYSFKIFMMLEAHKLGFNKVIWIDSAVLPLRDPTPLFAWLDQHEAVLLEEKTTEGLNRFILPATRELLKNLTGTDVHATRFLRTILFGLKMDAPRVKKLIELYYEFADLGTPFLSCFPEEFVLTAIIGQKDYHHWWSDRFKLLRCLDGDATPSKIKRARKSGCFFYHLPH